MKKGKVLVTGGCGFIGREVVKQLLGKNYSVVIADNFSNATPLKDSESLKVINYDLTKSNNLLGIFKGVDYCIHLAAKVGGVKYMNSASFEILKDNILIDSNVVTITNQLNIKLVYASTVIVYDQSKDLPYKEDKHEFPPPESDYGFSKLVGERLCKVYGKNQKLEYTIARIFNVYGINPNEQPEKKLHVIVDLIRKILKDKRLKIIGGGMQIRMFVHVSDVANALILMMESKKANGEIFNIASREKYQILEVAEMIWELLRKDKPFSYEAVEIEGNDFINNSGDVSKIKKILGWEANESLKKNLPKIVEWYKEKYEAF